MEKAKEQKMSEVNKAGQNYFISGIRVPFPAKAYPSQITMMHKILRGLDKKQNCLLESPTGSGKTLALLCSCLAWQKNEKDEKQAEENILQNLNDTDEQSKYFSANKELNLCEFARNYPTVNVDQPVGHSNTTHDIDHQNACKDANNGDDDDDDLDFKNSKRRFRTPSGPTGGIPVAKKQKNTEVSTSSIPFPSLGESTVRPSWKMELNTNCESIEVMMEDEKMKSLATKTVDDECCGKKEIARIPRIFFGTRTHKQIAQIVRELKKTAFRTCRMTILSSREHSCVHPGVLKSKDKNEECRRHVKGIDHKSCIYHTNSSVLCRQRSMEMYKLDAAWDIEDLVVAGKKAMACPYYAAREMMESADIIFCPYNYLVDPHIRSQVRETAWLSYEAHNIEDSAREAASITVTSTQLEDAMDELNKLIYFQVLTESHGAMKTLASIIHQWLESLSDSLTRTGFETAAKLIKAGEMVERLAMIGVTPSTFKAYKAALQSISAADSDPDYLTNVDAPKLTTRSMTVLRLLVFALEKVLDVEQRYTPDFRIVVSRKASNVIRIPDMGKGWKSATNRVSGKSWEFSLNFWCLNPAVVFSEVGTTARCIILTSGTLSPMSSFSSELGVSFPIQFEANHVIQDTQAWVGALTVGPDNQNIIANYQSSETFSFQDGVGKIIMQICKIVPHGVLCFFASYSLMDKLKKRWMLTGLWEAISRKKVIYSEPRGSDRFDGDGCSTDGALLLAVCRGKISEGLDFSDNNARAVITIGIPFPDFKDMQVELKRKYNNEHCRSRGLLNGSEWYEIQAYRALNQALGRCIRHRKDWGAILLVDERFGRSAKYKNGLSKWVRRRCKVFNDFHECVDSVAAFATARTLDPCPEPGSSESNIQTPEHSGMIHSPASSLSTSLCASTIVRPDEIQTPRVRGLQNEPRNLHAELLMRTEEKTARDFSPAKTTAVGICSEFSKSFSESNRLVSNFSTRNSIAALSTSTIKEENQWKDLGCCNSADNSGSKNRRFSSLEDLLKPVRASGQNPNSSGFENLNIGRTKLFKETSLCSSEGNVKREGNKSAVKLENDEFLDNLDDKEFDDINFDALDGNKFDADAVKVKTEVRVNSPSLFSEPWSLSMDASENVDKKPGDKCRVNDVIDVKVAEEWDDGSEMIVDAELTVGRKSLPCKTEERSSKKSDVSVERIDDAPAMRENLRKPSKKRVSSAEKTKKSRRKDEDVGVEDLKEPCNAVEGYESSKGRQKRSNIRMSSRKKKDAQLVGDASSRTEEDCEEEERVKHQQIVSCIYCNTLVTRADKLKPIKPKPSALSKYLGSSFKQMRVFLLSSKNLMNIQKNIQQADCQCPTNGLKLNSILLEEKSLLYVPLYCETCYKKRKPKISLIGFKFVQILSASEKPTVSEENDVWLLVDKLTVSPGKS
eukprot:gene14307-15796_t